MEALNESDPKVVFRGITLPIYGNYFTVGTTGEEVILSFGFVDPIELDTSTKEIIAEVITRVALSPTSAQGLLEELNEILESLKDGESNPSVESQNLVKQETGE